MALKKWNTNFRWNIPSGKKLPFQMFLCSRKFSAGLTQNIVFHLLSNQVFRKLFLLIVNHQTQSLSFFGTSRPSWETSTTIMEKSLGTVVQFERFLTQAKLYPRTFNTVRPYPLPPTPQTVLKLSRHNSFDLSTLYWVGRGEGTWKSKKTALLLRHNLLNV